MDLPKADVTSEWQSSSLADGRKQRGSFAHSYVASVS